jgi:uncharacterized membrane protein YfcA
MELVIALSAFLVGILVSIIGTVSGGGTAFISVPFFMFIGLPANAAIATNKFSALGAAVSTVHGFGAARKIVYRHLFLLVLLSIIGSVIGTLILIELDQQVLSRTIGILLLVLLPMVFVKNIGLKRKKVSSGWLIAGFAVFFLVCLYDGIFSLAAGLFGMFVLIFFFGMTYVEANATSRVPWLVHLIVSLIILIPAGLVSFVYGTAMLLGRFIGGYLGVHIALKKGENFVRIVFAIIVVVSALKLLFF